MVLRGVPCAFAMSARSLRTSTGSGIVPNRVYYVVQKAAGSFKVASSKGGSAITLGTATVSYSRPATTAPTLLSKFG